MTDRRELPPYVDINKIYAVRHCQSCHEDLDYGFYEAETPLVFQMPDGSLALYNDSCCELLRSLDDLEVNHMDAQEYEYCPLPKWCYTRVGEAKR